MAGLVIVGASLAGLRAAQGARAAVGPGVEAHAQGVHGVAGADVGRREEGAGAGIGSTPSLITTTSMSPTPSA